MIFIDCVLYEQIEWNFVLMSLKKLSYLIILNEDFCDDSLKITRHEPELISHQPSCLFNVYGNYFPNLPIKASYNIINFLSH